MGERLFFSQTIYFMTYSESTGFSTEHYSSYDQARTVVDEYRMKCIAEGKESDLTVAAHIDPDEHSQIVGDLIEDYRRSGQEIEEPMVVMFERTKEYRIVSNSTLSSDFWMRNPFIAFGRVQ